MNDTIVTSLDEFVRVAATHDGHTIWRGVKDAAYSLLSKAGRSGISPALERHALDHFRLYAHSIAPTPQPTCELEWMSLAQHHGLATRLLDWTMSALAAAFFAVESGTVDEASADVAIYAFPTPNGLAASHRLPSELRTDPFGWGSKYYLNARSPGLEVTGKDPGPDALIALAFIPPVVSPRIPAQSAAFLLTWLPGVPVQDYPKDKVHRFIIPQQQKRSFRLALLRCGVHRQALFPDLDGIAAHANDLYAQGLRGAEYLV